jgi:hypothetical protein
MVLLRLLHEPGIVLVCRHVLVDWLSGVHLRLWSMELKGWLV